MALTQVKTTGIADDAVTLAKQAAGTDGQIITYDASGNPAAVGPGTDGQVLTSTGAGSPPAFETPAPGVGGATGVDFNDTVMARWGTDNDMQIKHSGTDASIANNTGNLYIQTADSSITMQLNNGEKLVKAIADGAVELYHDNAKKFETLSNGAKVTGNLELLEAGSDVRIKNDGGKLVCGAGDDLQIYHDGSASYIDDAGTGILYLRSNQMEIHKYTGETMAQFVADSAVNLYYDNVKKFETTSAGVTVTGNLTVTGTSPGGIANAVVFRKSADTTSNCLPITDWEKEDGLYLPGEIGTFADPSSGVFTFPSTGYWYVIAVLKATMGAATNGAAMQIMVTNDNGGYWSSNSYTKQGSDAAHHVSATTAHLLDVEDTSNDKVKINVACSVGSEVINGDTTQNETFITFIRLGDT